MTCALPNSMNLDLIYLVLVPSGVTRLPEARHLMFSAGTGCASTIGFWRSLREYPVPVREEAVGDIGLPVPLIAVVTLSNLSGWKRLPHSRSDGTCRLCFA